MMTEQLEVSILAAPLAAIDRGVLSQAWYSALRLGAQKPLPCAAVSRALQGSPSAPPRGARPAGRLAAALPRPAGLALPRAAKSRVLQEAQCVRPRTARAPRPQLARAIETAFSDAALRRATFTLGRGSARIVVVLQTKGNQITLIALCRPHLRAAVARALAQARVALAARGIGVELRAEGAGACS